MDDVDEERVSFSVRFGCSFVPLCQSPFGTTVAGGCPLRVLFAILVARGAPSRCAALVPALPPSLLRKEAMQLCLQLVFRFSLEVLSQTLAFGGVCGLANLF